MRSVSLSDDRTAVSSVVGVLLLIAITVVLAGVVHTFAFSLADDTLQTYPTAGVSIDADADCDDEKATGLVATHVAGDSIPANELYLETTSDDPDLSGSWAAPDEYATAGVDDGTVSAGDTATVCAKEDALEGTTVQVVWRAESDARSLVLAERDGS
ncbi:type IV pilin [Halopiger xanaduensis]|uniref:Flagellin domain protein n=1 Tax=Halopiger xanaduensis (strain DSM 18323 / JCM 14033 / SH-6) TaxID=797210 RepID=F8D332_HALXS|nr:type IV pilin N-terminal domain-containing protein [Halopiger xanaduensis]AEH37316.1 flagellin domain protein [Halopiger xanaduensis SH-6]